MLIHNFGADTQGFQGLVDQNDRGKAWVPEKSHFFKATFFSFLFLGGGGFMPRPDVAHCIFTKQFLLLMYLVAKIFRFKLIMERTLGENDLIWEIMADLANRQLGCDQVVAIHLERRDYKTSVWGVLIPGRWTQCRNCWAPSWASSWSWWGEVLQAGCRWAQQHHLGLLAVSALVAGLSGEHSLLLHQRSLLMPLAWNFTKA